MFKSTFELHNALFPDQPNAMYRSPAAHPISFLSSLCERPKTEWVSGHYKVVYEGLGHRREWVDGYWRAVG